MSFPNISDIIATTIESRTKDIADNVTKNNAAFSRMHEKGNIKTVSGGSIIYEELSFAENGNAGWYSGYDLLPVNAADVISAAQYSYKQAAVPVVISGLEQLQNAGKEQMIDLLDSRLAVAESTMANLLAAGLYSDGTGSSGKQLTGLQAAVSASPTTGTYGGINRATWTFWQNQKVSGTVYTASTIQAGFNSMWVKLVRGNDRPDLILLDNTIWSIYLASLQAIQRFTSPEVGKLGFPSVKYMDADVVLDGGIGGFCPSGVGFFLNTKYIRLRPHSQRNMVPLSPNRRYSINQDAEVQILAWAGNLTSNGAQFQGYFQNS